MNVAAARILLAVTAMLPGCSKRSAAKSPSAPRSVLSQRAVSAVKPARVAHPDPRPASWYPFRCRARGCGDARRETIHERFALPRGCRRITYQRGSFADWVQHLPLLPAGARPVDYRGKPLETRMEALALVDIDIYPRDRDWQQCADYAVRLAYEYRARFRPGEPITWRLQNGKRYRLRPRAAARRRDLTKLFVYLGTFGLKTYYPAVTRHSEIRPGDVVVGNATGAIGHAVVVHDVIQCPEERRYLVSQSWMPAQSPHIPRVTEGSQASYVSWPELATFIRAVTGDSTAHIRRLIRGRS